MTNGERIMRTYPTAQINVEHETIFVWINHEPIAFDMKWWYRESKISELRKWIFTRSRTLSDSEMLNHIIDELKKLDDGEDKGNE